jgi:hypothetical protein
VKPSTGVAFYIDNGDKKSSAAQCRSSGSAYVSGTLQQQAFPTDSTAAAST